LIEITTALSAKTLEVDEGWNAVRLKLSAGPDAGAHQQRG
jgi:hypothetical protein